MAENRIAPGTDLKYMVETDIQGFDLKEDDFTISIRNRMGQEKYLIGRGDMLTDTDGNRYFTLSAVPAGVYHAVFTAHIKDGDFPDGIQHLVIRQYLETVGCIDASPCGCGGSEYGTVTYTRVIETGKADGTYIEDNDGNPIVDKDNTPVRLSMSAREAKELLEGRNANGKIDTIPELVDAASGMAEDTGYGVMSNDDVDDMMSRVLGNNNP